MPHEDLIKELRDTRNNLLASKVRVGSENIQSQTKCLGYMNEASMAMDKAIAALSSNTPDPSGTAREAPSTSLGTLSGVGSQSAGQPPSETSK